MGSSLKQRLKPVYRERWIPLVRATATQFFRIAVLLATSLRIIRPANPSATESFLIISLAGHLGDTVMLLPTIEALRAAHPHARIELAVEASVAPLLRSIRLIDHVHAFRLGSQPPTTIWLSIRRLFNILREWWPSRHLLRPTVAIVPRWGDDLFRSSTLAFLTQAPRRIGFASNVLPGQPPAPYRDAIFTQTIHAGSGMHEPAKFVLLLADSGLIPPVRDLATISRTASPALLEATTSVDWRALAVRLGIRMNFPFAVVAPGASMPRRVWPIDNWLPIIEALSAHNIQSIILAGTADAETGRQLHALAPGHAILVAGSTTIIESAALIAHARLFLGNDSGPGHLAGALAIPSTILFIAEPGCDPNHPAAPERIRPAGPHVTCLRPIACVWPCTGVCTASRAHCIRAITSSDVISAVEKPI